MTGANSFKETVLNIVWKAGIRCFRLVRRVNLSTPLAPVFARLAALVPGTGGDLPAILPTGASLWMPAGYRDARTVVNGLFQEDETKLFHQLIRPGMTFVDVGAYVGYFTILGSSLVGRAGRVYAFEPDGMAYQYLLRNIAANDCANVSAVNRAVSDSRKPAVFVRDPRGPESFVTDSLGEGDSQLIETLTLDSFFEAEGWPRIDLVKMNIEGGELHALRGFTEAIRRNEALQLVMEFNPMAMRRAGVTRDGLTGTLRDLGFSRARIVERDLQLIQSGHLLPRSDAVYNVLLAK